jgi:D-glycero-alpha-D-manno-heptose 1-phosphate guanylyltransferase
VEAIILAGGQGTRLRSVVADVPKPMAPIQGKPFLYYLLNSLKKQGIKKFIISVGYKSEHITDYFGDNFCNIPIIYAHELIPLGTGGAVRLALQYSTNENVFILNGDSFFSVNINKLRYFHEASNSDFTLALRKVNNEHGRYGNVDIEEDGKIINFDNSNNTDVLINGGIYFINKESFLKNIPSTHSFSLENDFLKELPQNVKLYGVEFIKAYFIDIGIPPDFERAQIELPYQKDQFKFLFLDRDGVLNKKIDNGYVLSITDFEFLPGVLEVFKTINKYFDRIIIITNQRGVGRGLMSEDKLNKIHEYLKLQISNVGGYIDNLYFCPSVDDSSPCRKPNAGMLLKAISEYSDIQLNESIIIGDSLSDLVMGKNNNMKTVFLTDGEENNYETLAYADEVFLNLKEWFNSLIQTNE